MVQDILSVIPAAGLLSKGNTQQIKAKEGTALDNMDPKGTILCRVTRASTGPIFIQWGKEWDFWQPVYHLPNAKFRRQKRGFEGKEFPGCLF